MDGTNRKAASQFESLLIALIPELVPVSEVVTLLVSHSCSQQESLQPEPLPLSAHMADRLSGFHRVAPSLKLLIERSAIQTDDDSTRMIGERARAATLFQLGAEHSLLHVRKVLEESKVEFRVLKGAATQHLDYRDPSLRQFSDIDILVRPENLLLAAKLFEQRGATFVSRVETKGMTLRDSRGVEIDLHSRFLPQVPFPEEAVWSRSEPFAVAGEVLHALTPDWRLIHAIVHAQFSPQGHRRLSSWLDVPAIANSRPGICQQACAIGSSLGLGATIAESMRRNMSLLGVSPTPLQPIPIMPFSGKRDRLFTSAYLGQHRSISKEQLCYLLELRARDVLPWLGWQVNRIRDGETSVQKA